MTIALALKVNDGLVLAADSATTVVNYEKDTAVTKVENIYNNANKIINLHKGLPVALMTWGLGSADGRSVINLAKELRSRLEGKENDYIDWELKSDKYSIEDIAGLTKTFFHDEVLSKVKQEEFKLSEMGLLIAGYSSGNKQAEAFSLTTNGIKAVGPSRQLEYDAQAYWAGQPEFISRVFLGMSSKMGEALKNLGVSEDQIPAVLTSIRQQTMVQLLSAPMPIQDVIDLADFLIDSTIKFTRYIPGDNTVGGPVEIASITRHEGFKWIKRKLFYDGALNGGN